MLIRKTQFGVVFQRMKAWQGWVDGVGVCRHSEPNIKTIVKSLILGDLQFIDTKDKGGVGNGSRSIFHDIKSR